MTISCEDKRT